MKKILVLFTCLLLFGFAPKSKPDAIIGTYYCSIYSYADLKENIILKKEIPTKYDTVYKPENDIGWQLEFLKNGEIKATNLVLYYCGFDRITIEKGTWKPLKNKEYEITLEGKSYSKPFTKKTVYSFLPGENGDVKLEAKN